MSCKLGRYEIGREEQHLQGFQIYDSPTRPPEEFKNVDHISSSLKMNHLPTHLPVVTAASNDVWVLGVVFDTDEKTRRHQLQLWLGGVICRQNSNSLIEQDF